MRENTCVLSSIKFFLPPLEYNTVTGKINELIALMQEKLKESNEAEAEAKREAERQETKEVTFEIAGFETQVRLMLSGPKRATSGVF